MQRPQSFDIFDTLIARRCIEPRNLLVEIERAVHLDGFADRRLEAEAVAAVRPCTLDDIYQVFREKSGLDAETSDYLKAKEIEFEIQNAIGIRENLDAVQAGDILIADTYLPRSAILKLLDKVGLRKQVGLVISSGGKRSGDVWPKLKPVTSLDQHLGSDPDSDVKSTLAAGIYAEQVSNSALTQHEAFFRRCGLELLARAVRETRLKCVSTMRRNEANQQALLQINNNIPMLVFTSVYLRLALKKLGATEILFCSPDCSYLRRIFNLLGNKCGWNIASECLHVSRLCQTSPSENYLKYFRASATSTTLVFDLCGTGASFANLYLKAGITPHTILLHEVNAGPDANDAIRNGASNVMSHALLSGVPFDSALLKLANYTDSSAVMDVRVIDGYDSVIPILEHANYSDSALELVRNIEATHEAFNDALGQIDLAALVKEIEATWDKIPALVTDLYKNLCASSAPMMDLGFHHLRHDRKTAWRLEKLAAP